MKGLLKVGTVREQHPVVKPNGSSKPIEIAEARAHTHILQPIQAQTPSLLV